MTQSRKKAKSGEKASAGPSAKKGSIKPTPAKAASQTPRRSTGGRGASADEQIAAMAEQIRSLIAERDEHVAIAEAAELEQETIQRDLEEARERIRSLEKRLGGAGDSQEETPHEESSPAFEEPDEEEPEEDLDEVESIYGRMDDPRVRRQELDRERLDRESESSNEPFWMVCPKCGDTLEEVEAEEVKIDRCGGCGGVYLDHGEVEVLLAQARGPQGLQRTRNVLLS